MVTCPVCEHQQALPTECEVCGKAFSAVKAPDLPAVRLPELESTRIDAAGPELPQETLPELEQTRLRSGPELPPEILPELERARAPAVNVPTEQVPELERHRLEEDPAQRTPAPSGAVVCRYCRNVQAQGLICDRCGMRLPRFVPASPGPQAAPPSGEEAPIIRHACGVKTRAGMPCSSCGVFVPLPAA